VEQAFRPAIQQESLLSLSQHFGDHYSGILGSGIAKGSQELRLIESSLKKFFKEGAALLCSRDSGKPVAFIGAIALRQRAG